MSTTLSMNIIHLLAAGNPPAVQRVREAMKVTWNQPLI